MRRIFLLMLALSCGGASVEWAGRWQQPTGIPPGSFIECTLDGHGQTVTGSGIQHREAGTDLNFTVSGTAPAGVTFSYSDQTTESFAFSQPDHDHITLTNASRTVNLVRQ
jgi:hypothetical protein